jgi:hypothetical protein
MFMQPVYSNHVFLHPVMKKILLFLVAFSVLNQSIDLDYCVNYSVPAPGNYDDIDSLYELLVERFTNDSDYMDENDWDEDGSPKNAPVQKDASSGLFSQEIKTTSFPLIEGVKKSIYPNLVMVICKGHSFVVSPPPDRPLS